MERKIGKDGKELVTSNFNRRVKMKGKGFGILIGICLLAAGFMLLTSSPAHGQAIGLMKFGDVDNQQVPTENHIYANTSDSAVIRAVLAGRIPDEYLGFKGILWNSPGGGLNGDVDGDNDVDENDAGLIQTFSLFVTNTFTNMPDAVVADSVTIPGITPVTISGGTATINPGQSAVLTLEIQNLGNSAVANAETVWEVLSIPALVTVNGMTSVGDTAIMMSSPAMADTTTRAAGFGQITVTVDTDLATPSGTVVEVAVYVPGITEITAASGWVLGRRAVGIPGINIVPTLVTFRIYIGAPEIVITDPVDGQTFCTSVVDVTVTTTAIVTQTIVLRVDGATHYTHVIVAGDWGPTYATYTWTGVDLSIETGVANGPHDLQAAMSPVGFSPIINVIVDVLPPVVNITQPADGSTVCTSQVEVLGTCVDAGFGVDTCVVEVNGQTADMSGGSATFSLADGYYTATLTGTDVCTNVASVSVTFLVDGTPPLVTITAPTDGATFCTSDVTVTASCTDLNGSGIAACDVFIEAIGVWQPSGFTFAGVPDGPNTVLARAIDDCGNVTISPPNIIQVDTTPPLVTITLPTPGSTLCSSTVTFTGTATDSGFGGDPTTVTLAISAPGPTVNVPVVGGVWSVVVSGLIDGNYTATATAADVCGVTDSAVTDFLIDTTPPLVGIIQPTQPPLVYDNKGTDTWGTIWDPSVCGPGAITYPTQTSDPMFGLADNEIGVGHVVRAQVGQTVVVPININLNDSGPNSYIDAYQLIVDFDDSVMMWTGANTGVSGPDPNVPSPWTGPPVGDPEVTWNTNPLQNKVFGDGVLVFTQSFLPPPNPELTGSVNIANLCFQITGGAGATHDIYIYANTADGAYVESLAGIFDIGALNGSIEVYTPQTGTIVIYDGDDISPGSPVEISLTVTTDARDGSTVLIPINGVDYTAPVAGGQATLTVDNFNSGPNTVIAQVTDWYCPDVIGYSGPLTVIYRPGLQVTITVPAPGQVFSSADDIAAAAGVQVSVTVSAPDADVGSTVDVTVNGQTALGYTTTTPTGGVVSGTVTLQPGWNTITADVYDGKSGTSSIQVYLDTAGPLLTVVLAAYATSTTVTVDITASDPLSSGLQDYNVDCGSGFEGWQPFAGGCPLADSTTYICTVPGLDGLKLITVEARDCVLNVTSTSDTITLDTTPPTVTVTDPTCGNTLNIGNFTVDASCADATSGCAAGTLEVRLVGYDLTWYSAPHSYVGVPNGDYTAEARADDNAGNTGSSVPPCDIPVRITILYLTWGSPAGGAILDDVNVTCTGDYGNALNVPTVDVNGTPMVVSGTTPLGTWSGVYVAGQGNQTLVVNGFDGVNPAATTLIPPICVDSIAPVVAVNPIVGCQTSSPVVVTGTVVDAGVCGVLTVDVNGTGADVVAGNWTATVPLGDGMAQVLTATATDAAGNTDVDNSQTVDVDTTAPTVAITAPADGSTLPTDQLWVRVDGTAADATSGPAIVTVTVVGVGSQNPPIVAGNWTATFIGLACDQSYTITADLDDNCGNAAAQASITIQTKCAPGGFLMSIDSPLDGGLVVTVNGITHGSVIATIPADVSWIGGTPPYDTSGLAVEVGGLVTTNLTVTSPTTASGKIQVACDESPGSFGTAVNVTISSYGVIDSVLSPAAPASVTVTLQIGEIGVEDVTIYDYMNNFTVPVNVYYDANADVPADGFMGYDITVNYDTAVVNVDCAAPTPVTGSDNTGEFYASEFPDPVVPICDNVAGVVQLNWFQGVSITSPTGFFNVANINMFRVGAAGTSSPLTVGVIDFCNANGKCVTLPPPNDKPVNYPPAWPVWPNYVKDGRVDIIAAPQPRIDAVDDDFAAPYDNAIPQGMPTNMQVFGANFIVGSPVVGCADYPVCTCFGVIGQTAVCVEQGGIPVFLFGSGNVVSSTEIDTTWNIFGAGGPLHIQIENPDSQQDTWGPGFGDPGLTIF